MTHDKRKEQFVIGTIRDLSNYFSSVSEAISAPYNLSALQTSVILDVYNNEGKTKITDICKRMQKNTNTISPIINRLILKDYLDKTQDSSDGRVFHISLTDKSLAIIKNIKVDIEDFTWPIFDNVDDETMTKVVDALKILKEAIDI